METLSGRQLVAAVAGPRQWSDTRQSWIDRAARRAGVSYRTARAIYYGEIDKPNHPTVRLMRHAAEQKAKREAKDIADKFEDIARAMRAAGEDIDSETVAALIGAARLLRGLDRA